MQSTNLAAPPSIWALLTFALTTVICLALDSSAGYATYILLAREVIVRKPLICKNLSVRFS